MSNNIFFSIIIITKSNYKELLLTLDSVADFNYGTFEVIVINGSKNEYKVPDSYGNSFSLSEIYDDGVGIYNAMNLGIEYVKGDYVVFMKAGDLFVSNNIFSYINSMLKANSEIDVLYGAAIRTDGSNDSSSIFWPRKPDSLLFGMIACHQSIYYRSSLLFKYKFEENNISNDWKHLLNLYRNGYSLFMTNRIFSLFDTSGLSSKRFFKAFLEKWKYARQISQNRLQIDARFSRKLVRIMRGKFERKFREY